MSIVRDILNDSKHNEIVATIAAARGDRKMAGMALLHAELAKFSYQELLEIINGTNTRTLEQNKMAKDTFERFYT